MSDIITIQIELLGESTVILTAGDNTLPGTSSIQPAKSLYIIDAKIDNPSETNEFVSFWRVPEDFSLCTNIKLQNINTEDKTITSNFGVNGVQLGIGESIKGGIVGFAAGGSYTYEQVNVDDTLYQQVYADDALYNELMTTGSVSLGEAGSGIAITLTLLHLD